MFKKSLLATIFILSVIFQGCTVEKVEDTNNMIASNEFVLTSTENKQYIIKKTKDGFILDNDRKKILILDIYATWCPPCKASAKHLSSLQEKYKDDLIIIGITIEGGITNNKLIDFKRTYNASYILVNSDQNRLLINEVASKLELGERFPIPMMAIYKDGKLIKHYLGAVEEEFLDSDIKNALQ